MVANTHTFTYAATAQPLATDNGTLVQVPYTDPGIRYPAAGPFIDRGDLAYSNIAGYWWEFDFTKGVRLTHKSGFDGIGVQISIDGVHQGGVVYLTTGVVYFEAHPNTSTVKTVRVTIADQSQQDFLLQTGLEVWI